MEGEWKEIEKVEREREREKLKGERASLNKCHYKLNYNSQYRPFYTKIKKKKIKKKLPGQGQTLHSQISKNIHKLVESVKKLATDKVKLALFHVVYPFAADIQCRRKNPELSFHIHKNRNRQILCNHFVYVLPKNNDNSTVISRKHELNR